MTSGRLEMHPTSSIKLAKSQGNTRVRRGGKKGQAACTSGLGGKEMISVCSSNLAPASSKLSEWQATSKNQDSCARKLLRGPGCWLQGPSIPGIISKTGQGNGQPLPSGVIRYWSMDQFKKKKNKQTLVTYSILKDSALHLKPND